MKNITEELCKKLITCFENKGSQSPSEIMEQLQSLGFEKTPTRQTLQKALKILEKQEVIINKKTAENRAKYSLNEKSQVPEIIKQCNAIIEHKKKDTKSSPREIINLVLFLIRELDTFAISLRVAKSSQYEIQKCEETRNKILNFIEQYLSKTSYKDPFDVYEMLNDFNNKLN